MPIVSHKLDECAVTPLEPSFYAAFGSKESLFGETVALYLQSHGTVMDYLCDTKLAPRAAIELALRGSARMQREPGHPSECMVALGVMGAGIADNAVVTDPLTAARARNHAGITACVQRGVDAGELGPATDVAALHGAGEGNRTLV